MNTRRHFLRHMGVGVSAAVASAAGVANASAASAAADDPAQTLALLQEERAIRALHRGYEEALNRARYDEVIAMFAADAEVLFNGGLFRQRTQGLSRLYRERFSSEKTGRRMDPAPGFELADDALRDSVEVASDRQSAKAVFPFSMQVGRLIESESSLASMARLHGEGVQTWWEGGLHRVVYRKRAADGLWQISRLEYHTLSRADYRPGRSYAKPISVARLSTCFPADAQGPDELV